jgi:hypothetical protein
MEAQEEEAKTPDRDDKEEGGAKQVEEAGGGEAPGREGEGEGKEGD